MLNMMLFIKPAFEDKCDAEIDGQFTVE